MSDTLLKKPDVIKILKIGRNKLYDIINSGEFIVPIRLPNTQIDLYSHDELQEWIKKQKEKIIFSFKNYATHRNNHGWDKFRERSFPQKCFVCF